MCGETTSDIGTFMNKTRDLYEQGKWDEALKCIDDALKLDDKLCNAWYNKGEILEKLSLFDKAIDCYWKVIELTPPPSPYPFQLDDPDRLRAQAFIRISKVYNQMGLYKQSLVNIKSMKIFYKGTIEGRCLEGDILCKLGQYKDALVVYDEALSIAYKAEKETKPVKAFGELIKIGYAFPVILGKASILRQMWSEPLKLDTSG